QKGFSDATAGRAPSLCDLSVGEAAARRSRECGGGKCPPQISHSRDQPGGPERKRNSSAPAPGSQLSP
ncbi:MAG: hypothetical protein J7M32_12060, partial [Deltaproteobacteria bacterium]|nr:hypothetical protein [Deltaproteobacteria bacterium]